MKLYTEEELQAKTRQELWAICDSLKLSRRRSKADCIANILAMMPQKAEPQAQVYIDDVVRAELNAQGYRDCMEGVPQRESHHSYLMGYLRAQRDMVKLPDEAATIEKAEQTEQAVVVWRTNKTGIVNYSNQDYYFTVSSLYDETIWINAAEQVKAAILADIPRHKKALCNGSFVSCNPSERGYSIKQLQVIHQHPGFTKYYA